MIGWCLLQLHIELRLICLDLLLLAEFTLKDYKDHIAINSLSTNGTSFIQAVKRKEDYAHDEVKLLPHEDRIHEDHDCQ